MARSAEANKKMATFKRIQNDRLVQQANEKTYARIREDIDKRAESGCDFVTYHKAYWHRPFSDDAIYPEAVCILFKNNPRFVEDLERDGYNIEFNYECDGERFDNVIISWGNA